MNRKILIIKGFSQTETELINDRKIIKLYTEYFSSKAGGCYDLEREVTIYEEPTIEVIKELETNIVDLDFLILVLLGHGANKDGIQIFQLSETIFIQPGELQFKPRKQILIIETCRNIIDFEIEIKNISRLVPKFKFGGIISHPKTVKEATELYNQQVLSCEDDITYLFAASIDESAYNYYFISTLIDASIYYHEYFQNRIFNTKFIFEETKREIIVVTEGKQNPVIVGKGLFPFALSII